MVLPHRLLDVFRRGEAVLVTGLNCGILAGQPGWPALLEALTRSLHEQDAHAVRALRENQGLGPALADLVERLGEERATQLVAGFEIEAVRPLPAIFSALCHIPFRAVVTTAFANTWERALTDSLGPPTVLSAGAPLDGGDGGGSAILIHALGRASVPETLCLSARDLNTKISGTGLDELLSDLARSFSLVFVGFQAGDPDLEWIAGTVLGNALSEQPHYILHHESAAAEGSVRSSYGLETIAAEGPLGEALIAFTREALIASGRSEQDAEHLLERSRAESLVLPSVQTDRSPQGAVPDLEWGSRNPVPVPESQTGVASSKDEAESGPSAQDPISTQEGNHPPLQPTSDVVAALANAKPVEPTHFTPSVDPPAAEKSPSSPIGEPHDNGVDQQLGERDQARETARQESEAREAQSAMCLEMIAELERHTADQRWDQAATVLERLLELEQDPGARARYLQARAVVHRKSGGDQAETLAFLERAIEEDGSLAAAWDGLERLHRESGDVAALRRCQVRRLRRSVEQRERAQSARLFQRISDSARQDLGDRVTAVAALEAARALAPEEGEHFSRDLAQLYVELGPTAADKAIAAHQSMIARTPESPSAYGVLARLWGECGATTRSAFATAAHSYLESAQGERASRSAKEARARVALPSPTAQLTDSIVRDLAHPDDDLLVGEAFAIVGPALAEVCSPSRAEFRSQRGQPVQVSKQQRPDRPPSRDGAAAPEQFPGLALHYFAEKSGIAMPDLYLVDSASRPLVIESLSENSKFSPALLCLKSFTQRAAEAEVLFTFAHLTALLRPPTMVRFALPSPELLAAGYQVFQGLGKMADRAAVGPTVKKAIVQLRRRLESATLDRAETLLRTLQTRGFLPDLQRWLAASDLTAARAALVLTGDLAAALATVARQEKQGLSPLSPSERINDLLSFAMSERHFSARRALGLDDPRAAASSSADLQA